MKVIASKLCYTANKKSALFKTVNYSKWYDYETNHPKHQ